MHRHLTYHRTNRNFDEPHIGDKAKSESERKRTGASQIKARKIREKISFARATFCSMEYARAMGLW